MAQIAQSGVYPDRKVRVSTNELWAKGLLQATFTIVPIVAGLDKFSNILTDWTQYLTPWFNSVIGVSGAMFMRGAGVLEIVAGIIVAFKPRIGGWIVACWLGCIVVNLFLLPANWGANPIDRHWDVAARDCGLIVAAIVLALLSSDSIRANEAERD